MQKQDWIFETICDQREPLAERAALLDGGTDLRTDTPFYRDARSHLKNAIIPFDFVTSCHSFSCSKTIIVKQTTVIRMRI